MKHLAPLALLALAGCQSYAPEPLPSAADLPTLDGHALQQAADKIERPYLKPVTIDLAAPLDENAVATIAVAANPDLKAARARAGISEAQVFAARLMPDPTLSLGLGQVLSGPDPLLDLASALGVDIASLRTRDVRLAQARAAADQVRLDLAWSEWQTAGAARIQLVRILALRQALALVEQNRAAARSLLQRSLRAAGRGDVSADTLQAARTASTDADDKVRTTTQDLTTAQLELLRLLGLPPETRLVLAPTQIDHRALDTAQLFAIARTNRTDLKALEAGYASQEAAVRKAVLDQFPTLGLTVNGNRDTSGNLVVGPTVDLTLPLWNRNRGGIAVEKATREALKAEYEARLFQTRSEIATAIAGIGLARRQRATALSDLPAIRGFAQASAAAAARGDLSAATAQTAEQTLRDREILIAQSDQAIAEQMIALELLTGTLREAWTP